MKKYHLFSVSANDVLLSHMITFLNDKVGLWNKSNILTQLLSEKPKLHQRVEPYCNQNSQNSIGLNPIAIRTAKTP